MTKIKRNLRDEQRLNSLSTKLLLTFIYAVTFLPIKLSWTILYSILLQAYSAFCYFLFCLQREYCTFCCCFFNFQFRRPDKNKGYLYIIRNKTMIYFVDIHNAFQRITQQNHMVLNTSERLQPGNHYEIKSSGLFFMPQGRCAVSPYLTVDYDFTFNVTAGIVVFFCKNAVYKNISVRRK